MATDGAIRRKKEWSGMPAEFFEATTFGELAVGDRFIALPVPGDNHGHGGFLGVTYLYKKIHRCQPYGSAVNAIRLIDAAWTCNPDGMPVLKIL